MLQFRTYLLGAAMAGALLAGFAPTASADLITLDPQAANLGAPYVPGGTCTGTNCVLDSTTPAFTTSGALLGFDANLDISSTPGTAGSIPFTESGSFYIATFQGGTAAGSNVNTHYNIYGTFTASGSGTWTGPAYVVSPGALSLSINFFGSPGAAGTSGLTFTTPTLGSSGVSATGAHDFALGTSGLIPSLTNFAGAFGACVALPCTHVGASETLLVSLNFTPAAGTTGPGGFFKLPNPFVIDIGSQNGGNDLNTFESILADGHTEFVTEVATTGSDLPEGGGSINFTIVPEPASLALLGVGLLALGAVARTRVRKA